MALTIEELESSLDYLRAHEMIGDSTEVQVVFERPTEDEGADYIMKDGDEFEVNDGLWTGKSSADILFLVFTVEPT